MINQEEQNFEVDRLQALRSYNILDTLTEKDYEDITYMASIICDAPIALISFVDKDRQWFKSHNGVDASQTEREYSFCAHALQFPMDALIVPDSRKDTRFQHNPLVTGEPNIVFYAGIPLVSQNGYPLGTVCVIDRKPRELTAAQLNALKILSTQVMNLLELRKSNYELQLTKLQLETKNKDLEQFAMVVSHDIKSPLAGIFLANELLKNHFKANNATDELRILKASDNSADKIRSLVDGILSYYKGEGEADAEQFDFTEFIGSISQTLKSPRPYVLNYDPSSKIIQTSKIQLEQIFLNLISNAIRYNDKTSIEINVGLEESAMHYHFSVKDNGMGVAEEDREKIFNLFTTISLVDKFGVKSHGIGLPIVKKIVESQGGTISLTSKEGEGTVFSFTIRKYGEK